MKKKDAVLVLIVLLAAAVLFSMRYFTKPQGTVYEVIIEVNGSEYARVPLNEQKTLTIEQENGAQNVVQITGDSVYMASSTCENQICVHHARVTLDNYQMDPFIICLPNRVSVQLKPEAAQ